MDLNKVSLIGYLESDPKSLTQPSGQKITAITVVTAEDANRVASDVDVRTAVPHNVVAHGRLGEIIRKYLKIGDRVYLEGRLRGGQSGSKDKALKTTTEIVATQLIMLGGRSNVRRPGECKS